MPTNQIQLICDCIRNVPDFPKPGIQFKDITPVLSNPAAFDASIEALAAPYKNSNIDLVVGIEARGFIFGTPVARLLGVGFVPIRKPGKLPWKTHSTSYELEYGSDALEIHADAVAKGQRVLVVDDLLATGGTARAACDLLEEMGADIVEITVLIELESLEGRDKLAPFKTRSVLTF